ncbi:MAG: hypothetical protein CVV52_03150 [Spirochaetae bacterium HGW-Spirochaetae-8]|nr:MAG: hypothetical protein CVV52_03150 [Spirochaetae bacterium HGW-Spirochaetae-8]
MTTRIDPSTYGTGCDEAAVSLSCLKNHPLTTIPTTEGLPDQGVSRELHRSAIRSRWFALVGHEAYTVMDDESVELDGILHTLQRELDDHLTKHINSSLGSIID